MDDAGNPGPTVGLDSSSTPDDAHASGAVEAGVDLPADVRSPDAPADSFVAVDLPPDARTGPNRMFITSTSHSPNLGGLAGADAACMKRAQAANLPGTFVALLSSKTVDARTRLGTSRGWLRTDDRPFADTQQEMFSGQVRNMPMVDEFAKPVDPAIYAAFTGSRPDGTRYGPDDATDWDTVQAQRCRAGHSYRLGSEWLSGFTVSPCMGGYRLYCFEVGRTVPVSGL